MSNLGDVRQKAVEVELDGKTFKVAFNLNAMALIEEEHGDLDKLMDKVAKGSPKATRFLLWAGLQTHHPELTITDVGAMTDVADMTVVAKAIFGGVMNSLPQAKPGKN